METWRLFPVRGRGMFPPGIGQPVESYRLYPETVGSGLPFLLNFRMDDEGNHMILDSFTPLPAASLKRDGALR
jgi:hypothetical protein